MQAVCAAGQIFLTTKHLFSGLRSGWPCCAVCQSTLSKVELPGAGRARSVTPQGTLKTVHAALHLASSLAIEVWELKSNTMQKN